MVARIITGKNIGGVLRYNEHKVARGQAELLLAHRFLQEPQALRFRDKLGRFERLLEKSPQVTTHAVHISLNFAMGEVLEKETLQRIATEYMDRIGFGGQPFLVYHHLDAAHPHLHIVTTNIRPDGRRINLHNIGRERSEPARKALEQVFGLVRAEGAAQEKVLPLSPAPLTPAQYGTSETKQTITRLVSAVTRSYNYTSLAELNAVLRTFNVIADPGAAGSQRHRRGGLVYSLLDKQGRQVGVPLKASALPGKPTLATLQRRFTTNGQHRNLYREVLRKGIERAFITPLPLSRDDFARALQKEQIQVLFRENQEGRTYGITFIDHRHRVVCNGSELGKAYGAKALLERLEQGCSKGFAARECPVPPATPATARPVPPGAAFEVPDLLRDLLQVEKQGDYLPHALKARKKKRRKRPRL